MTHIKILDAATASKIAAGEVIERPSAVLKELLENSLDAGATVINVDIEGAGKKLIRVNDNGSGIAQDDLPIAFLRHSTSKINNFEDLNNLNTFGFRGEALFSVCAISEASVSSFYAGQIAGSKVLTVGGADITQMPAPAIQGTTVEVRNVFFNTPARLKFLKSDNVERGHILRCFEEAAIANPTVTFNINCDGVKVYNLPAQPDDEAGLRRRLSKILGVELTASLAFTQADKFNLRAFLSPIDKLTAARDRQFLFVNKRPITCKILQQAIYKAYQQYKTKDRFPAVVLSLQIPPDAFDVNIHPQKKDIKFVNESDVFSFIYKTLSTALLGGAQAPAIKFEQPLAVPAPQVSFDNMQPAPPLTNTNLFTALRMPSMLQVQDFEEPKQYSIVGDNEVSCEYKIAGKLKQEQKQPPLPQSEDQTNASWWQGPYNYLGQVNQSYLVFENPQGLVLMDQHAAQERVLFEQYLDALNNQTVKIQPLMFPINVDLPASDVENILAWTDFLAAAGFDIARFSTRTILINTVPALLKLNDDAIKSLAVQLASVLGDPGKSSDALKHGLIATMACKKAIKAGERLESKQAAALIENLNKCKDGLHCPHGRPTIINIDMKELAKKFGRL